MTEIETRISTGDADPHFYMCGRLIRMNKPVVTPIHSSVLFRAWNLKEKLLAREEESGHFVFQFKSKAERDRIASGRLWSFNGVVEAVHAVDGEVELLASQSREVGGLVKESALQVEEAAPTGLEDGLSGSEKAAALVVSPPNISAGNPSFKIGLIELMGLTEDVGPGCGTLKVGPGDSGLKRKFGFGTEADGFGFSRDRPVGNDLVLKKPKSSFHSGELVEVPVRFRSISQEKSPKKRGRPRGSRNKKRTTNRDPELSDSMAPSSEGANAETGLESEAGEE
ncbi:hypothetical protein ACLB2K_022478 [Fragaria x ananassa]